MDSRGSRVTWVALHLRLVLAGIYLWVSGSDAIGPNPLIGSLVHFGGAPRRASRTLLGLHVLGAPVGALVSLGDALIWIGAPPMLVLLGVLSNLGGFLHLPDRYGLPHCRARIHRAECRVRGPSAGVIGFGSWVAARNLGRWKIGRLNGRYLCGEECIALNILNGITRRQNGFTYAEARIRLSKSGTQAAREKAGLLKPLTIAGIREAVEVGRDYLGLEMPRRNLDEFDHLSLKAPIEEHGCQSRLTSTRDKLYRSTRR